MKIRALGFAASILAILVLGACGGGDDKEDAEQTVRDIVGATSDSDGEKFCSLVTKELREQVGASTGDKSEDGCKKVIDSQRKREVKVTKITKTEQDGDKVTVTAVLEDSGQQHPQVFELKKEDGELRLASARE